VVGARGQHADEAELGNADTARRNWQDGEQTDERERRKGGLPGHLGLGEAYAAHARQQDQPECEGADGCGGGDPPAPRGEEPGGPLTESLQGPGGGRRRRPAREPAGDRERALERRIRAERERLATQKEAEANSNET
jgi:hypothetical protein